MKTGEQKVAVENITNSSRFAIYRYLLACSCICGTLTAPESQLTRLVPVPCRLLAAKGPAKAGKCAWQKSWLLIPIRLTALNKCNISALPPRLARGFTCHWWAEVAESCHNNRLFFGPVPFHHYPN